MSQVVDAAFVFSSTRCSEVIGMISYNAIKKNTTLGAFAEDDEADA